MTYRRIARNSTLLVLTLTAMGCGGSNNSSSDCGNAVWDEGEECDAGDLNSDTGNCRTDCTLSDDLNYQLSGWVLDEDLIDAIGVEDATAPLGSGAWSTSSTDLNGDALVKFELNLPAYDWTAFLSLIDPDRLGDAPPDLPAPGAITDVTVSDIAEISFRTRRDTSDNNNFYLVIYTQPELGADGGPFFGSRLTALPSQARMRDEPDDTWTKWTTIAGVNQLAFADQPVIGTFTGANLPTLAELTASPTFDWQTVDGSYPTTSIDYGSQKILHLSLQTSSGTASSDFDGLLDEIIIRTTDGRTLTIDLDPETLPSP